jgi:hypothetical protein
MADRLELVREYPVYDVRLEDAADLEAVASWAAGNGMTVIVASGRRLRVRASADHVRALGELRAVAAVEEWTPPRLVADHVARIVWGTGGLRRGSARS